MIAPRAQHADISAVFGRHGIKDIPEGTKVVIGSDEDRKLSITKESEANLKAESLDLFDGTYRNGLLTYTGFRRTQESALAIVSGLDIRGNLRGQEREELAATWVDWNDPCTPQYSPDGKWIKDLVTGFFFRRQDDAERKLPVMSRIGADYLTTVIEGIEYLQAHHTDGTTDVWAHISHTPMLDMFKIAALSGRVAEKNPGGALAVIDKRNGIVEIDEDVFPRPSRMEELNLGRVMALRSTNPLFEVFVDGRLSGYSLNDLRNVEKRLRDYAA